MKQVLQFIYVLILIGACFGVKAQDRVVVHTVEEGQTLYSISKAYGVTPNDIQQNNPLIDGSFTIKPGQIIRIKLQNEQQIDPILSKMIKQPVIHKVKVKETLYGISRDYQVDMAQVKSWNKLEESRLSIGQDLIVGWRYRNKQQSIDELSTEELKTEIKAPVVIVETPTSTETIKAEEPKVVSTTPVVNSYAPPAHSTPRVTTSKQQLLQQRFDAETANKNLSKKAGPSIWFNTNNQTMSARYYALFSDAPIGSVIRVKNLINHRIVYVKVIGSLPNTAENHGAMMKMTQAAKETLGIHDAKMRVEVTFMSKGE